MKTSVRNLRMAMIACLLGGTLQSQTCSDGFETNSFSGWSGAIGNNYSNYSVTITSVGTSSPNFGIETATNIPCSNSISNPSVYQPLPAPGFGQYSARLGEVGVPGAKVEMLTYTFVPSVNDTNFLYAYTTYLQAPGHAPSDNPYFVIGLLDQNGDTIPGSFYMYQTGSPSVAGFDTSQCGSGLYFKPWTIRGVNLSPYVGQQVTLFAVNADCLYGGHYAYSYIDMDCDGVLTVSAQSNVTLTARSESGSTYYWNTGATTPTISVINPVPNSIYTCTVTLPAYYSPASSNYTFVVTYKIIGTTNVQEVSNIGNGSFYPNPVKDVLHFKAPSKDIKIYNITGQVVKSISGEVNDIDVSSLQQGLYFVQYKNGSGLFVEKLFVEK